MRKIAFYRKSRLLTQESLAEKLKFSESYMSQIECGKVKISLSRLDQNSEILNINIAGGQTECYEVGLPTEEDGVVLPCGCSAIKIFKK